ncbi:MAG: long-chain fatty acid--CoA ligase [Proteobacteria bacterium]|nr:long-chain fatty acid--CoA ligase [Pseudomonadota bacterium]
MKPGRSPPIADEQVSSNYLSWVDESTTLAQLWEARVRLTPSSEAYRAFDVTLGTWRSHSWSDMHSRVLVWRKALRAEGFPRGTRIGVLIPNGIPHVCADQAALAEGHVPVPLHLVDNPESLAYILADAEVSLLLVDKRESWEALAAHRARFPALKRVVYLEGAAETAPRGVARGIDQWLAAEQASQSAGEERAADPTATRDLAAIVYTSGTTGRPKGVMLSHGNVLANVSAVLHAVRVHEGDLFLSFLPLSHTFERTVGYYLPIAAGATVAFARSVPLLMEDLDRVRPTILVSVPRIYERVYAALRDQVQGRPAMRRLLDLTVAIGWRQFEHLQGRAQRPAAVSRFAGDLLDHWIGRRFRARFGGRLRAAVTGGAPLSLQVARPFLALGVPLLQGYGMTESAPVVACNTLADNDPATVGRPLAQVEVRIGEQDELLVRGKNVMMGYWRRPEDTARVLEADGWLHTGDQAVLEAGRIRIKGRLKDIIVTSTGEKIAPADLEAAILNDPLFEQAMVVGEQRPYLVALLVVSGKRWTEAGRSLGLDLKVSSLQSETARQWALERIGRAVREFPSYARPRAVYLTSEAWSLGNGLLTPTLKPKRVAIEARFADVLAELYRGHASGAAPL